MRFAKKAVAPIALIVCLLLACALAVSQGWLAALGVGSESTDSQVIGAVERSEEVALVALSIQGIRKEKRDRWNIPGSGEMLLLQYNFTAKLGIDGADVKVAKVGEHSYTVTVPDFIMIGFDRPTFDEIVDDGGVLSGLTPDIEQTEIINDILGSSEQQEYVDMNDELLKAQTKSFYDRIITGVDEDAVVDYDFAP